MTIEWEGGERIQNDLFFFLFYLLERKKSGWFRKQDSRGRLMASRNEIKRRLKFV